jgi:dynein heavy chain
LKVTNEPPKGIKSNIKRSFLELNEDWYKGCNKPKEFHSMFFSLALFHSVILERRKFGAIGWNIPYQWMNSDLETCKTQLKMYLEEQPTVPYETLRFLVAVINYGGRVTDNKDERVIKSILSKYFTPEILTGRYAYSESGIYYMPEDLEDSQCSQVHRRAAARRRPRGKLGSHEDLRPALQR